MACYVGVLFTWPFYPIVIAVTYANYFGLSTGQFSGLGRSG